MTTTMRHAGRVHRLAPTGRPVLRMTWHDLLFAHWPVDPAAIREHVPAGLEIDTRDGTAWLGVIPFHMTGIGLYGLPRVPGTGAFAELNLRTYVVRDGVPGVWFFTLDADAATGPCIARKWYGLNYRRASIRCTRSPDGWIDFVSLRRDMARKPSVAAGDFVGRYRPIGDAFTTEPGSLEHWLTDRYSMYSVRGGTLLRGDIDHAPWRLRRAEAAIHRNTIADAIGVDLHGDPHLLYAEQAATLVWMPRTVGNVA